MRRFQQQLVYKAKELSLPKFSFFALLICIGFFSFAVVPQDLTTWHHGGDFSHYFASAIRMQAGENPYEGTLEDILKLHNFPLMNIEWKATNPPALILVSVLISFFPPITAYWLWNLLQVIAFSTGAFLFFRTLDRLQDRFFVVASLVGIVVSVPFILHIRLGQTQLLLCGLIMSGLALIKTHPRTASFLLGVCASLKLFTLPLGIVALRQSLEESGKKRLNWLYFPAGFATLPIIAELWCDGFIHQTYITEIVPYVRLLQFEITMGASLSFLLFFLTWAVLYRFDAPPNLPEIAGATINTLVSVFFVVLIALENFKNRAPFEPIRSGLFCLTACILCSPVAWPHYFVLLFPSLVFLWHLKRDETGPRALLIVALYAATALCTGFTHAIPFLTAFWGPAVLVVILACLLLLPATPAKSVEK